MCNHLTERDMKKKIREKRADLLHRLPLCRFLFRYRGDISVTQWAMSSLPTCRSQICGGKNEGEKREESHSLEAVAKKKKNIRAGGISFDGAGSTGYFALAVEIECLAMHLGNNVHGHTGPAALLSDRRADIWQRQSRPKETLFLTAMAPVTFPQYHSTFLSRENALVYFWPARRSKKIR